MSDELCSLEESLGDSIVAEARSLDHSGPLTREEESAKLDEKLEEVRLFVNKARQDMNTLGAETLQTLRVLYPDEQVPPIIAEDRLYWRVRHVLSGVEFLLEVLDAVSWQLL